MALPDNKLTTIGRLYVWSVAFEPLLFFVVAHPSFTGISANLGRILQIFVLIGLSFRWLLTKKPLTIFNPASPYYVKYTYYYVLAILAGIVGLIGGAYTLEVQYDPNYASSFFAAIIRSSTVRPLFEYFIAFYYF